MREPVQRVIPGHHSWHHDPATTPQPQCGTTLACTNDDFPTPQGPTTATSRFACSTNGGKAIRQLGDLRALFRI
jgi:hypothetical protein